MDERLVGYWSDFDLYLGSMEAAEIAFRRDGFGWTYWARDGGAFSIHRFTWRAAEGALVLALYESVSGVWTVQGRAVRHEVRERATDDKEIALAYEVRPGQDVLGKPVTLFASDQRIILGTIGDRFALKRELADDEVDPAARLS